MTCRIIIDKFEVLSLNLLTTIDTYLVVCFSCGCTLFHISTIVVEDTPMIRCARAACPIVCFFLHSSSNSVFDKCCKTSGTV